MKYIFRKLSDTATFEEFRAAHLEAFGEDYFQFTEPDEIPSGKIEKTNDPFISIDGGHVSMWIDDGDGTEVEI